MRAGRRGREGEGLKEYIYALCFTIAALVLIILNSHMLVARAAADEGNEVITELESSQENRVEDVSASTSASGAGSSELEDDSANNGESSSDNTNEDKDEVSSSSSPENESESENASSEESSGPSDSSSEPEGSSSEPGEESSSSSESEEEPSSSEPIEEPSSSEDDHFGELEEEIPAVPTMEQNIYMMRRHFDLLVYFVIPVGFCMVVVFLLFYWFYKTFIDSV